LIKSVALQVNTSDEFYNAHCRATIMPLRQLAIDDALPVTVSRSRYNS
jgi:hypothetical protein